MQIKPTDGSSMITQEVEANVRCISTDKQQTINLRSYKGRIGFLLTIPFSSILYEHTCRVLFIQVISVLNSFGLEFHRQIIYLTLTGNRRIIVQLFEKRTLYWSYRSTSMLCSELIITSSIKKGNRDPKSIARPPVILVQS